MKPLSPAEAEERIFSLRGKVAPKSCGLEDAAGKILRQDITADHDFPPFDRVMMDGLAVRSNGGRRFLVQGVAAAGKPQIALPPAEDAAVEVMTGAVLPGGADAVLPCEWYELHDGVAVLQPGKEAQAGEFIHRKGSDHFAGDALLRSGVRLGPVEIGIAAACGCAEIQVAAPLRIAVLGTGDELVPVGEVPKAGQIRRSNTHALAAALQLSGHGPTAAGCLRDDPEDLRQGLATILSMNDLVILTGGVSKGRWDLVPEILVSLGATSILHGIAQRPGKPMGVWQMPGGQVVFGLPGNPVSALVCLHRYVLPALSHWSGESAPMRPRRILHGGFTKQPGLTLFLPVREMPDGTVAPAPVANSGDFVGLAGSDGFVEVDESFADGEAAPYFPWLAK
ncbi:MAG: molybdopterin molybdotransferase MoeA [Terrimicrobiaceae bacterium]